MSPISKLSDEHMTLNRARNELSRLQEMCSEVANMVHQIDSSLSVMKQLLDPLQVDASMDGLCRNTTINLEESSIASPVETIRSSGYEWKDSLLEITKGPCEYTPPKSREYRYFKSLNDKTKTMPQPSVKNDATNLDTSANGVSKVRSKKTTSRRCSGGFLIQEMEPQPISFQASKPKAVKGSRKTKSKQ